MAERTWTCQRQAAGVKCRHVNAKRYQICRACGKRRPPSRAPAHMAALDDFDYQGWCAEFGEVCGICGAPPPRGRRLYRDHDHRKAINRGLLCFRCNTALRPYMTAEWLLAAAEFVRTAEARNAAIRGLRRAAASSPPVAGTMSKP